MSKNIYTILGLVMIVALGAYFFTKNRDNSLQTNQPNPVIDPTKPQAFISEKLGISFQYLPDQDGDRKADISVQESGDKVFIFPLDTDPQSGQYVEKFTKEPSDNLNSAIKKKFLSNFTDKQCFAESLSDFFKAFGETVPPKAANLETSTIDFPRSADPNVPFWENDVCPKPYSVSNGLSYFIMDKSHPNKFYFISIGQYAILAEAPPDGAMDQKTWQDSFQVIN